MTTQVHPLDLIPAYALGALDPEETHLISQHLMICESCQMELRACEQVVEALPLAVRETEPPPVLKSNILNAIESAVVKQSPSLGPSLWERLVDTFRRPSPAFTVVALALILVLTLVNTYLWRQLQASPAIPDDLQTVAMVGTAEASEATGLVVFDMEGHEGTLVVDGLTPLDASQQYQLWLIKDDKRDSGGVFAVSDSGYGWLKIVSETPLHSYSSFRITIESVGGNPVPTGQKVMGSEF